MNSAAPRTGLKRHPDFLKLWAGQTVSQFGSAVTTVALPLVAVLGLHADAWQMGILGALAMAPFLLISLLAGVYVDRLPRRPLLIGADLGRLGLTGAVPVLWALGRLHMADLYSMQFLVGCLTVIFDLAYQSYLPSLIPSETLVDGNRYLEISQATSQTAGPGLGGLLVNWLSAGGALVADALSYGVSALSLSLIGHSEGSRDRRSSAGRRRIWGEIREGLGFVFQTRVLWLLAGCTATANFFAAITNSVYVLYFVRSLHLPGALTGVVYGIGGVGGLVGAWIVSRVTDHWGLGPTLVGAIGTGAIARFLVPLAPHSYWAGLVTLSVSDIGVAGGAVLYNINQVSLRQVITPNRLLGRMNASIRFMIWGTMPLGSVVGGLLGSAIGLDRTLWIGAIGGLGALLWVTAPAIRALRQMPSAPVVVSSKIE
jgi:MFS family permease